MLSAVFHVIPEGRVEIFSDTDDSAWSPWRAGSTTSCGGCSATGAASPGRRCGGGVPDPRPLTDRERAALDALLSVDVPGVNALRAQAAAALADPDNYRCGCGSVSRTTSAPPAPDAVHLVAPVELQVLDAAGDMTGHVTLRLRGGVLQALEVGWYDEPLAVPDLADVRVVVVDQA